MSDINKHFNPPRVLIAAFLLARDEADTGYSVPDELKQWGLQCVKVGMTAVHSGDCTKESHACARCIAEHVLRDADDILALVGSVRHD